MASAWSRIGSTLGRLLVQQGPRIAREAPKLLRQIQSGRGSSGPQARQPAPGTGRPVASRTRPSSDRARTVSYSPDLDGKADPGEIVWTWVVYEEDASQGKDRPVLVVGRDGTTVLGLMLSSQSRRDGDPDWLALGPGSWDAERRESWVRLDRVLDVPEDGIRREGAVLGRSRFDAVAARLRAEHGWR
ncbi:type II toxin-antitoxin system PemK/MazF family toxin [Rhodococcus antarcticus]|uniref:Type II toxin-antitoxin system PemK/MazF family toxin n=1 Tax=Rhodococcus antarcticus TaxID=2987751 RepID=A0ABY6NXX6_9NOCA|nr:type II toxin-antitoxin system PemK/MazF family toxin [Rhodococcus antarcticus]UZJ23783.1 type II toxin-antitoxin system PemK/MazF family toxin [Rhodococcus antarcticus]